MLPNPDIAAPQRLGATRLHFLRGLRAFLVHALAFKEIPSTRAKTPKYGTSDRELFEEALDSIGGGEYKGNYGNWGSNYIHNLRHAGVYAPAIVAPAVPALEETAIAKYKPYVDELVDFGLVHCQEMTDGAVLYSWAPSIIVV